MMPAHDAGHDAATRSQDSRTPAKDAGHPHDAVADRSTAEDGGEGTAAGGGGCSCEVATGHESSGRVPFGAVGSLILGLGAVVRRRRPGRRASRVID